jgi:uncharacterized protein
MPLGGEIKQAGKFSRLGRPVRDDAAHRGSRRKSQPEIGTKNPARLAGQRQDRSFAPALLACGARKLLELRPNCECRVRDLLPDTIEARIGSFECAFCRNCADNVLAGICPNCGGNLVPAPFGRGANCGSIAPLCSVGRALAPVCQVPRSAKGVSWPQSGFKSARRCLTSRKYV